MVVVVLGWWRPACAWSSATLAQISVAGALAIGLTMPGARFWPSRFNFLRAQMAVYSSQYSVYTAVAGSVLDWLALGPHCTALHWHTAWKRAFFCMSGSIHPTIVFSLAAFVQP